MPIQVQVTQTGLEASIQQAAQKAGRNLKINLGTSARDINALSQPLGRITGQADEFTKSMEAANARVLAFGASVGILNGVVRAFKDLVSTTIEVEKSLASINAILQQNSQQVNRFKNEIFEVAKNTEQNFATVAEAALELSRQGLKAEEVTKRLNDALILSRLSGLDAANSVAGLTSAINAFNSTGITSSEVLNKLSAAAASAAVSERDLIEAIKRSGSVAVTTGVEFDELVGIVSALQQKTSRGGAVIGNSLKTIFTRIQSLENLETLQDLGVQVTDLSGNVVSSSQLIENLAGTFQKLDQQSQINLADKLVGKFQIAPFLALLEDYNSEVVTSARVAEISFNATNEAYQRNVVLNQTLSAVINEATVNFKQLANTLGEIGVTDSLKNIVSFFSGLAENIKNIVEGDGIGSDIAKGFIKGFSAVLSGPCLAIVGAIIAKLAVDLVKFGTGSLKTFFGLNKAAKEQATIQGQIASTLLSSQSIQKQILAIENSTLSIEQKRAAQAKFFTTAINEQLMKMKQMQTIAATISPAVMRGTASARKASGGFLPIGAEKSDISRGVGGAPSSAKPVVIPNFAFGGGQRGTMVANDSEYIVPNYANGGDAIFNQNMAASMGLPSNARKISAASGFVPNFAIKRTGYGALTGTNQEAFREFINRKNVAFTGKGSAERWNNAYREYGDEFSRLSETDKRNLRVAATQKSILSKGVSGVAKYGVIFPDAVGNAKATRINIGDEIVSAVPVATDPPSALYEEIRGALINASKQYATKLGFSPDIVNEAKFSQIVSKSLNPGSIEGAYGTVFESAFQGAIGLDSKSNAIWDLPTKSAINSLLSQMKASDLLQRMTVGLEGVQAADFKNTLSAGNMNSVANKIKNSKNLEIEQQAKSNKKTRSSAYGYIPNFAGGALEDAIQREQAAGLPVNQIRINQSGKLRNAQNPMGLAVTNTRDEPTGAIPAARGYVPNFVDISRSNPNTTVYNDKLSESAGKVANANRDMLGTIFALQIAMSALTGVTSDAESGLVKFVNIVAENSSKVTTTMFAFDGLKSAVGGTETKLGAFIGKLGPYAVGVSAVVAGLNIFADHIAESSGANAAAADATVKLAKAAEGAALSLDKLDKRGQRDVTEEAKKIFEEGSVYTTRTVYSAMTYGTTTQNSYQQGIKAKFEADPLGEFKETDLEKAFQRSISEFLASGATSDDVKKRVEKISEDGLIAINEVLSFADDAAKSIKESTKRVEKFISEVDLTDMQKRAIANVSPERLQKAFKGGSQAFTGVKEALEKEGVYGEEAQLQAINLLRDSLNKKEQERTNKIAQIELSRAKANISNTIELAKLKLQTLSVEEKRLIQAQAMNDLSLKELINLENIVEAKKFDLETSQQLLDKTNEYLEGLEGITAEYLNTEAVQKKINDAIKDGNVDLDDAKGIIDAINSILPKESKILEENAAAKLKDALAIFINFRGEQKQNADAVKKENDQNRIRVDLIKKAADEADRLRRNTEFDIKFDLEEGKMEFEAKQRKLDLSKGGASQQAVIGIDIQKAEIARNQVLKENAARLQILNNEIRDLSLEYGRLNDSQKGEREQILKQINQKTMAADQENRAALQKADADLEAAKAAGVFKNALALASDAFYDLGPQLENLKLQSKIAPTIGERAAAARKAGDIESAQAAVKSGEMTIEEALRMVAQSDMRRGLGQRYKERGDTDPLKMYDDLMTKLEQSSDKFRDNMIDGIMQAVEGAGSLSDILRNTALEFAREITRTNLTNVFNMGRNALFGGQGYASGGKITGGSGNRDDVPAMLMGGEYVIKKDSVQKYGLSFMDNLNNGNIPKFAKGGYFAPGFYGQGEIKGKKNLLDFATQAYTTGSKDVMFSSGDAAAISLEPESVRLSSIGRNMGTPMQRATEEAKGQAFDLYLQQLQREEEIRKAEKERKKALKNQLIMAAVSTVARGIGSNIGAGVAGGLSGLKEGASFGEKLSATFSGGMQGLKNFGTFASQGVTSLFSGDFKTGFSSLGRAYDPFMFAPKAYAKAIPVNPNDIVTPSGYQKTSLPTWDNGINYPYYSVLPPKNFRRQATGGSIPSATGIDTVPAMLSGGEFVMNNAAAKNIGTGNLNALNSGASSMLTEEKSEELNQKIIEKLDELIESNANGNGEINITVNNEGQTTQEGQGSEQNQNFAKKIRDAVIRVIEEEKRLGGTLRRGLA